MNNAWRFGFFWAIISAGVLAGSHPDRALFSTAFACICALIGMIFGPEKRSHD